MRVNEDLDPPTEAPVLSFEQFTTTRTKHAQRGDLRFRARVSTQELTGDNGEVTKAAVGHIWEATGSRFMFVHFHLRIQVFLLTYGYYSNRFRTKQPPRKNGNAQQVFECCQTSK